MNGDTTARANRQGHPCPTWCVTDHDELEVPWDPSLGYLLAHGSGPMRAGQGFITLRQDGAPGAEVKLDIEVPSGQPCMCVRMSLSFRQAGQVAALLDAAHGQPGFAAQVRAAMAIALEAGR